MKTKNATRKKDISSTKADQKKVVLPLKQLSSYVIDNADLIIRNTKVYADNLRTDETKVTSAELKKMKACKTLSEFKMLTAKHEDLLKVRSKHVKSGEANHARERQQCRNIIARTIDRLDFVVEYGKASK